MTHTRRKLLTTVGTVGGIAVAGCLGGGGSEGSPRSPETETTTETTAKSTKTKTGTSSPEPKYSYARKGTVDKPVVTYIGNWKCKYCRLFSVKLLPQLFKKYVEPGKLTLRFRALAYNPGTQTPWLGNDAPRAARAGLIVWNIEPESYWPYHEYVFKNQPPETETWATAEKLVAFASASGVKQTEKLTSQIGAGKYEAAVKQTAMFAEEIGIGGTPSLLIDGELVDPLKKTEKAWTMLDKLSKNAE